MRKNQYLKPEPLEKFYLRYIEERDLELLRVWKNKNKERFFYQKSILPKEQKQWFLGFIERPEDYMYIVEILDGKSDNCIGCMGFRIFDNTADVYNVIRGKDVKTACRMSNALQLMLNFIVSEYPDKCISCKVLANNPAVLWYKMNGFRIEEDRSDHFVMLFDKTKLEVVNFKAR